MEKFKIKVDKKLWDVLSGQIVMQRRTSLPCLTVAMGITGKFNVAAQRTILKDASHCNFYKLKNGMLLIEVGNEGLLKITRYSNKERGIECAGVSVGRLRKYVFNELNNKKLTYHFYLHPTDRNGLFILKELTNSWE